MNHRQHHLNLLALLRQPLDDFRSGIDLPRQCLNQAADFGGSTSVLISGLANVDNLL